LIGERGQGKSSALYWVQEQVKEMRDFATMVVVDVQKLLEKADSDLSPIRAAAEFSRMMRLHLLEELFPAQRRRFLSWLLAGPPDEGEDFDRALLTEFADLAVSVRSQAGVEEAEDRQARRLALQTFFKTEAGRKLLGSVDEKAQPLVRPAHVLQAARIVKPLPHLIMAYDNIDQLHGPWQRQVLDDIEATHAALGGACDTLVAIRRENVNRLDLGPGGGAYAVRVIVANKPYLGVQLPEDAEIHTQNVLGKRHTYVRNLLYGEQESKNAEHLAHADQFHGNIVGEMVAAHIQRLANFNMRNIVRMYVEFGRYVRQHVDSVHSVQSSHLATLLFLWLFEEGDMFGIELHDVFKVGRDVQTVKDVPRAASASHLLMTCLLNLMQEREREHADLPRFNEVMNRMRVLGFGVNHIGSALKSLSSEPGQPPKIVAFVGKDQRIDDLTDETDVRMRLTICGMELVGHVFNRVGYVGGRAYKHYAISEAGKGYLDLSLEKRIEILLNYMVLMTKQHLYLLESIRDTWMQREGEQWLLRYRQWFGVNALLQVERILDSAGKFFSHEFPGTPGPFLNLKEAYASILDDLTKGDESWKQRLPELENAGRLLTSNT
jgi:hypothetical protein